MRPRTLGRIAVALLWLAVFAVVLAETPSHRRWLIEVTARQYPATFLPVVVAVVVATLAGLLGADPARRHRATAIAAALSAIPPAAAFLATAVLGLPVADTGRLTAYLALTVACVASVAAIRVFARDLALVVALSLPLAVVLGATCDTALLAIVPTVTDGD